MAASQNRRTNGPSTPNIFNVSRVKGLDEQVNSQRRARRSTKARLGQTLWIGVPFLAFVYVFSSQARNMYPDISSQIISSDKRLKSCTTEEKQIIASQLQRLGLKNATKCPEPSWYYAPGTNAFPPLQDRAVAISVGCNKGFDAVDTLRLFSQNATYTKKEWIRKLGIIHPGSCGQMDAKDPEIVSTNTRPTTVHCIEPLPATASRLLYAAEKLGWQDSFRVYHAAMSSVDGSVLFPVATAGTEHLGMDRCETSEFENSCSPVKQYCLDTFVKEKLDSEEKIDYLSIDAEGYDCLVLEGGRGVLRRVRYLEFENHQFGAWASNSLELVVNMLEDHHFACYWAGRKQLWRITHGCWVDEVYNEKVWSNVACINLDDHVSSSVATRMEDTFRRTLGEAR